ncbi:MAG: hypothetical protein JEZ08_03240 [Clostridiales bacterium]|nr:hypothetical protein [Clostridiales bacterium]
MKVNSISYTKHMSTIGNKTDTVINTEFSVLRIPTHKDNIHLMIKTYGEKELKRFGILKCKTCEERTANSSSKSSDIHQTSKQSVRICQECGRCYLEDGSIQHVTLGDHIYHPSLNLFMGLKIDQRL